MNEVLLDQWDERCAPADQPILRVSIVGTQLFLDICELEETSTTVTHKRIGGVSVSVHALLWAIGTVQVGAIDRDLHEDRGSNGTS